MLNKSTHIYFSCSDVDKYYFTLVNIFSGCILLLRRRQDTVHFLPMVCSVNSKHMRSGTSGRSTNNASREEKLTGSSQDPVD